MEGAGSPLHPLRQLVPVSVLDEWSWNESYLIWETHLVPSFFLSSNHSPGRYAPSTSSSCPAKPSALAVQWSAPRLRSNPLSRECVKSLNKRWKIYTAFAQV